jgi:hypothetical protein
VPTDELSVEFEEEEEVADQTYLDALQAARRWARQAIIATKLIGQQRARETDTEYDQRIEAAIDELIDRVVAPGEFYLVRAGNNRKGTGTFYTRPQLAVPTVHRTLEPLCFDKDDKGVFTPKTPDQILALKVCDPACGSASFLVAALHYLTEALYKSLCHHCGLDDPKRAAKITLPFGKPATGKDTDATVPLPPDDPNRGEEFAERVQALLRRHIVERCIYGVDINPLAIEFARVSLWVETLDPELPFSFLDHKIKVGNALIGCRIDELEHYPIRAWEREGGDGSSGDHSERIVAFLNGEKIGSRRTGRGLIKRELNDLLESHFSKQIQLFPENADSADQVVNEAKNEYEALHATSIRDPDNQERQYRINIKENTRLRRLRYAMDEWCAIWFWPSDEERLKVVPTPLSMHSANRQKEILVDEIAREMKFFHWELEFPDVCSSSKSGFDAMVGNPPWETAQPNLQEYFTDHDPNFRTYTRVESLDKVDEMCDTVPHLRDSWLRHCGAFKSFANWVKNSADPFGFNDGPNGMLGRGAASLIARWKEHISRTQKANSQRSFRYQVGRVFTYKLFLEHGYHLLNPDGQLGMIVPAGIYSDKWSQPLRELFLDHSTWRWLFGFENKQKLFSIHSDYPFACVLVSRRRTADKLRTAFRVQAVTKWESREPPTVDLSPELLAAASPKSRCLPELRTDRDLKVFESIYRASERIGSHSPKIEFSLELMMNVKAKDFPAQAKWVAKDFRPDVFGRWHSISPMTDGWKLMNDVLFPFEATGGRGSSTSDVALPLYEGLMFNIAEPIEKAYYVDGAGSEDWHVQQNDNKRLLSHYLMSSDSAKRRCSNYNRTKIVFRDVTNSTNQRSFISTVVTGLPCGNTAATLTIRHGTLGDHLAVSAALSSLCSDFVVRQRLAGKHLNWFIVEELPIPRDLLQRECDLIREVLALRAGQLAFLHRKNAPDWLALAESHRSLFDKEWKLWWSVTESDRLRMRIECEALTANLIGMSTDDYELILRDETSDLKGFWRVDKDLPYEERLTGLSARAFRALKEGKWSAETVGQLSNDEFFDLLGIPELTNAAAAQAKGLSGPLILKRDGCHSWHPENFAADDPRHGWTWDDCRKDAITLLGSEEALEEYIAQATASGEEGEDDVEPDPNHTGPKDLFGNAIPTDLFGNELRPKKKRRGK